MDRASARGRNTNAPNGRNGRAPCWRLHPLEADAAHHHRLARRSACWPLPALPREEEPQIVVPMIDVFVRMPGASPAEVEQRVTRPMEKLLWEIPGVEYLYSTSSPGQSLVIVRFLVGEDEERALVRLNQKLAANMDLLPAGVSAPLVKPRSIDDVPVMALTIWGPRYDDFSLRQMAAQIHDSLKEVPNVSAVEIIGGRRRQMTVEIDPARMASYGIDALTLVRRDPGREPARVGRRSRQRGCRDPRRVRRLAARCRVDSARQRPDPPGWQSVRERRRGSPRRGCRTCRLRQVPLPGRPARFPPSRSPCRSARAPTPSS